MNRKSLWTRAARARGFTLIEVMIVIAIVLALSAIVGVAVLGRREQADVSLTQTKLNNIKSALKFFKVDFGRYPSEEEGLAVLWDKEKLDADADVNKYSKDGYMEDATPNDQWGNPWGYRFPSTREDETQYDLWSYGPNGEDEDGDGDDITSWRKDDTSDGLDSGTLPPPPSSTGGG